MVEKKDLLRMCCVCKKIEVDKNWIGEKSKDYQSKVDFYEERITHGYCPICCEKAINEVKEYNLMKKIDQKNKKGN